MRAWKNQSPYFYAQSLNMSFQQSTINCKGRLLNLENPLVMGILNLTPDSFYDGGKYHELPAILDRVSTMVNAGAAIIDVGGVSTRPGADLLDVGTELSRVVPVVEAIANNFPELPISVDTFRAEVAHKAVEAGASIVNDISAGTLDQEMYRTVAALQVPYILMHMQNTPGTMQQNPVYRDIVSEIADFFMLELAKLKELGIKDIILDPGFGFGKTAVHNFELLQNLDGFLFLEQPLLAGLSRKSMVYKTLGQTPDTALNGTTALNMIALERGAKILRVHDVSEAVEVIRLFNELSSVKASEN
jgi:dihydropteroate synthase